MKTQAQSATLARLRATSYPHRVGVGVLYAAAGDCYCECTANSAKLSGCPAAPGLLMAGLA
jgi:hypothetical protein